MKTVIRLILPAIAAATFLAIPAFGQVGFTYTVAGGKTTITGYSVFGRPTDMTIPSTLGGGTVVSIGQLAFNEWPYLKRVTIPDSVTNIGNRAFEYCSVLTSVTIGANVITIGSGAFQNCTNLASISIPNSVTNLGTYTFHSCAALTNATIGSNVGNIGDYTFYGCSKLTNVTIPNSVNNLGPYAFYSCTSLTNATIGSNVGNIGDYAFYGCSKLTNVTIPNSVTNLGTYAFYSCTALANVSIGTNVARIGDSAFYNCRKMSAITFPDSVSSIGASAYALCTNLTSITIPKNVTNIGNTAFSVCLGLTAFTVNASNAYYCSIDGVLLNKNQTTLIQYPARLSGRYTIPTGVSNIAESAFSSCIGLTGITIPTSVVSIGITAFDSCTALTSVSIPSSVKTIENGTFAYCTNLTNTTISSSVTSIGYGAYQVCTSLSNVYFLGNAPRLGTDVFYGDPATIYHLSGATDWPVVPALWGDRPTALWFPVSHLTVNAGYGGGSWTYGQLITVTAASLVGHTFDRWTGATQYVASVTAATTTFTMPAQDVILTAEFKGNSYAVTFDAVGGTSPSPTSKSVTNDATYGNLAVTTRPGYTFGGWWTGASGTGTQVLSSTTVAITAEQTLYAKWTLTTTTQRTPCLWLDQYGIVVDGDYESAALADVDGDGYAAWQEYVTGSNPTNRDSFFKSFITVSNGLPTVTWTPNLGTARLYTVEGRAKLTEGSWGMTNESSRFFRVKVDW